MNTITDLALLRLMQLISPSLPIGAFTYSQGIEWCVEAGWLNDADRLEQWLSDLLQTSMQDLEIPILLRMMQAWSDGDTASLQYWSELSMASRETAELRMEEKNRAYALFRLLSSLELAEVTRYESLIKSSQAAGYSFASVAWHIPPHQACLGYVWSWLENLVIAAVKLVPLGQTDGQKILMHLSSQIDEVIERATQLSDDEIGCSSPALAIASAQHETQYTRLFRS
ncbi:MAG: urease accessory protein UreF [Gammaproteobacteria bacterium]|nr:MAG: urease accessory protein UreF [Gammaproteobacteria bacterium]